MLYFPQIIAEVYGQVSMCANTPEFLCKPTIAFHIMKPPAILDDRRNAWLLENAVANAELQDMTSTLGRFEVGR